MLCEPNISSTEIDKERFGADPNTGVENVQVASRKCMMATWATFMVRTSRSSAREEGRTLMVLFDPVKFWDLGISPFRRLS